MLVLGACSSPEDRNRVALMDQIENQVTLPRGSRPLADYARYYTYENGDVHAEYVIPLGDDPRPDATCEELDTNLTGHKVDCPDLKQADDLKPGQRRWFADNRDFPIIMDGGCAVVNVVFDPARRWLKSVTCNGDA
jgi:hypothetical protein